MAALPRRRLRTSYFAEVGAPRAAAAAAAQTISFALADGWRWVVVVVVGGGGGGGGGGGANFTVGAEATLVQPRRAEVHSAQKMVLYIRDVRARVCVIVA